SRCRRAATPRSSRTRSICAPAAQRSRFGETTREADRRPQRHLLRPAQRVKLPRRFRLRLPLPAWMAGTAAGSAYRQRLRARGEGFARPTEVVGGVEYCVSAYLMSPPESPWGDYCEILVQGMSTHLPRKNGLIQLERTGPFVPPISFPGIADVVVTDSF